MSIELTQRAKALIAGAAFTAAVSLAVFPGVAQAQSLDGVVNGTADGSAETNAPVDDGAALDSGSGTTQNATVSDQPQLDGMTDSTTEAAAPIVPAEGNVSVDGTAAAGDILNEDVCLNAGLNDPAGSCGGTAPAGDAGAVLGTDAGTALDGGAGVVAPAPVDSGAALDSGFGTDQYAATSDQPRLVGATDSTTAIDAPVVPVEGGVGVDQYVGVGDVVGQDVCLNAGVNQDAGTCADGTGSIPADPVQDPLANGQIDGTAGLDAPAVPAEGSAAVDQYAAVGDVAGLDVCLNAAVNQNPGTCDGGTTGDASGAGLDAPVVGDASADSNSGTTQDATITPEPQLNGTTDSTTEVSAEDIPIEGATGVDGTATAGDVVNEDICLNASVNQDPGSCGGSTGEDASTPPATTPMVDGDVNGTAEVTAPDVPVQNGTTVDSDVAADGLADLGICLNGAVNQDAGTCGETGAGNTGGDAGDVSTPIVDGNVDGITEADAPAAPVQGGTLVESDVAADDVAALGVCLGAGVNQEAGTCGEAAPGGDGGSGDGVTPGGDAGTTPDGGAAPGGNPSSTLASDAGATVDGGDAGAMPNGDAGATPDSDAGDPAGDVALPATEMALASGATLDGNADATSDGGDAGASSDGDAGATLDGGDAGESGVDEQAADAAGPSGAEQATGGTVVKSLPDTGGPDFLLPIAGLLLLGFGVLRLTVARRRRTS